MSIRGIWAALPTPFTVSGALDLAALKENVQRAAVWGIPGVYTTDSDGEFYALEFAEFRELASVFGRVVEDAGIEGAMGITWAHTQGMIERGRAAIDCGIPLLHVGFPFWMPLAPPDLPRFFDDLAAALPESRWIHYRTPRCHVLPNGFDYESWRSRYPEQLVGTKLVTSDMAEVTEILAHSPGLAHFAGDHVFAAAGLAGVRGIYSFWVNVLPKWILESWRLCEQGRWSEAFERQKKLIRWETDYMRTLKSRGHLHAVLAKARNRFTSVFVDSGISRAPYHTPDRAAVDQLEKDFAEFWADEIAEHRRMVSARL
jgi:dihydrodipicolinate synthase/N-acetylneuraminate lyase